MLPIWSNAQNISTECLAFKKFKIVVIGSSTAAGSGASTSDSAWVNRYRKHLQTINPENQVINLALGGYNTYRLMPDEFMPPTNRPTPDSARNITAALAEMPDAIILNLPSNDVSSGYSVAEQLSNFDSIVRVANHSEIPIWVATTQPKNFNNMSLANLQIEVRDSIFARYGDHALDFWNGLANDQNGLDSLYNSGDGTHLNDAGHGLLFERVRERMILLKLAIHPVFPDYTVLTFEPINAINCSNDDIEIELVYSNLGQSISTDSLFLNFTMQFDSGQINLNIPPVCKTDTLIFPASGYYGFGTLVSLEGVDGDPVNNVNSYTIDTIPSPKFTPESQTICRSDSAFFNFNFQQTDTVYWYDQPTDSHPIAGGKTFQTSTLDRDTTFWVEAVNGELFYKKNLFTTDQFNRDWNGLMFDLTVTENAVLDSLHINMFSTGQQILEIYKRDSSLIGAELNAAAWELFKIDTLNVNFSGEFVNVSNLNLNLSANDTVGIYLQLQDPTADMNYLATTFNESISDDILTMTNGTGITHNFAETYFPRLFSGEIFYHHGNRPLGDCSTGRQPVEVKISEPEINLPDEAGVRNSTDTVVLDAGAGFAEYLWSNGATTQILTIPGEDVFNQGDTVIWVTVIDEFGCSATDSIPLFIDISNVFEKGNLDLSFFPNPGSGEYNLIGDPAFAEMNLFNLTGQLVFSKKGYLPTKFDWSKLNEGLYFLKIRTEKGVQIIRVRQVR